MVLLTPASGKEVISMPEKEISLAPLPFFNPRRKVLLIIFFGLFILIAVCLWGFFMNPELYGPNYAAKRLSPSLVHLFGTDQLGRDMFYRTISGLSLSIQIGLLSAVLSSFIALVLGSMSAIYGGKVDYIINYLVDLCMGVPHLILLILISIACNGGASGVITGVALTHWPALTRVVRAEVMQVRSAK